jgi:catechol 2,3-dioxygenase-like lactoylglutathione lyase family enzyme
MMQALVHIALVVRDYDEAIDFYTKKLHFELVDDTYQPEQGTKQDKRALARLECSHYESEIISKRRMTSKELDIKVSILL